MLQPESNVTQGNGKPSGGGTPPGCCAWSGEWSLPAQRQQRSGWAEQTHKAQGGIWGEMLIPRLGVDSLAA